MQHNSFNISSSEDGSMLLSLSPPQQPSMLRIWEVDQYFKCPVLGLCLTDLEQRRLLKKQGWSTKKMNAHQVHEAMITAAATDCALSRQTEKLLNRKYRTDLDTLSCLDSETFMKKWRARFESDDWFGPLWVASIRTDLSGAEMREIFGTVHMAMHDGVGDSIRLKSEVRELQDRNNKLRSRLRTGGKEARSLKKTLKNLEHENRRLADRLSSARQLLENAPSESRENHEHVSEFDARLNRLQNDLAAMKSRTEAAENENLKLHRELVKRDTEVDEMRRELRTVMETMFAARSCGQGCDESCPAFDLCQKRILVVGGIRRMGSLYKKLIEQSGGVLEYHDGYVKNGVQDLENRFKRADMVLCPVNCNSHAACAIVKNLGKKHKKAVHMMPSYSLSAFSNAIRGNHHRPGLPPQP